MSAPVPGWPGVHSQQAQQAAYQQQAWHPLDRMSLVWAGMRFGFGFAIGTVIAWPLIAIVVIALLPR